MAELGFTFDMRPSAKELASRFKFGADVVNQGQRTMMSQRLGPMLLSAVQAEAPRRSGKFASGITLKMGGEGANVSFQIGIPRPLGQWIQEGTRPHIITPKGPGYPLRFKVGAPGSSWSGGYAQRFRNIATGRFTAGQEVRAMLVHHPGTKANRFVDRAYQKWLPNAQREINELGRAYVRAITTGAGSGAFGY